MVTIYLVGVFLTFVVLVSLMWFNETIKQMIDDISIATRVYFVIVSSICWVIFLMFLGVLVIDIIIDKRIKRK